MTIRALVVDDEPLARRRLRRLLAEHSDVEIAGEAASGDEAVELALEKRPHVIFMDVQMPERDGMAALRTLQDRLPDAVMPTVVFTTAFEEHAVEAFALDATDYLVKPIDADQLRRALRRVRREAWSETPADPAGTSSAPARAATGHLAGHRAGKIVNLPLEDVGCIQLEDTITWAHTPQGKFRVKLALHEAEDRLPTPPFVRVSRSAIVNLEWIEHLAPMFSGTYVARLRGAIGLEINVSRRRARELRELLGW
jgi:DNA-binding LytR/AlgR family response regulator